MTARRASDRTYLDWNATAPLHPAAREAMLAALDVTGNPSSPHGEGRRARALVEGARERIGACLGVPARQVLFTSGATEAANWVLTPSAASARRTAPLAALLVGATEHPCVRDGHRFAPACVDTLPVDRDGRVDVASVADAVARLSDRHGPGSVMLAVQSANNETGVLQPIVELAAAVAPHRAILVCDAVQSVGRMPGLPRADIVVLSAHKLGGPKGVGAAVFGDDLSPEPLLKGGGQEKRQRSGTENVAAIAGFAAALEAATAAIGACAERAGRLQAAIETGLAALSPDAFVFGAGAPRLPNTTCFAVPDIPAETALIALDLAGVAVSSGSACSSGKVAASSVLAAMGYQAGIARGALRVSTGPDTTDADVEVFLGAWRDFIHRRAERAVA